MGTRDPRAASRIARWRATASKTDCPSIFPPGEMQNLIECPIFLQFRHMFALVGKDAGSAKVGDVGDDWVLESWAGNVGWVGDRL